MLISDLAHTAPVRAALAAHDISEAYRLLIAGGVTQREIARATGQSQSEVSDIRKGRAVTSVRVLERIADGLGVERAVMGLGWGAGKPVEYGEPDEEVTEAVKRRNFINAVIGAVAFGQPIIRELLWPTPPDAATPLPRSLGEHDVSALRAVTKQMRLLARQYGGQADTIGAAAQSYTRLMSVSATDAVKADLGSALADLHTLAGWTSYDAGLNDHAQDHFDRALQIAGQFDDAYAMAYTVRHAGITFAERGAPNDALKLFQLGQAKIGGLPRNDPRSATMGALLHMESSGAFARMDRPDDAQHELMLAREGWDPPDAFDAADMDYVTAWIHNSFDKLDTAEAFAKSSLATWSTTDDRRDAIEAQIIFAVIHLRAREPDGVTLSDKVISGVAELNSTRARQILVPVGAELAARRKDSTAQDLARRVRQLMTA